MLLLVGAAAGIPKAPTPDFAQDYAAAWAVEHGRAAGDSTEELLAAAWDPELAEPYRGTHQPHPPLATVLALPLAPLPFEVARALWCGLSALAIAVGWRLGRVPWRSAAASVPLWCLALVLGTHEPLLFALLAAALTVEGRHPARAGVLLGASIALKVYPVLLLPALASRRRWRALSAACASLAGISLACEAMLGVGSTRAWLEYTAVNAERYADVGRNLSLVRGLRELAPGLPPILLGLVLAAALLTLLARRGRGGLATGIPVMLLTSPLTWRHYLGLLSLARPHPLEDALLFGGGLVALAFGLGWIEPPPRALVELPLFLALLSCAARSLLRSSPEGDAQVGRLASTSTPSPDP